MVRQLKVDLRTQTLVLDEAGHLPLARDRHAAVETEIAATG